MYTPRPHIFAETSFSVALEFERGTEKAREYAAKLDVYYRIALL